MMSVDEWQKSLENPQPLASTSGIQPVSSWLKAQPLAPPKGPSFGYKITDFIHNSLVDAGKTLLVKPADRFAEAVGSTGLLGNKIATGYSDMQKNNETRTYANIPVEQQKAFGQGGAKQVAGDALKSASYLAPVGRAEAAAGDLVKGNLAKGMVSGAIAGGIYGAAGGAGDALQQNADMGTVGHQAVVGGLEGAAGGAVLSIGGAALARTADRLFVSKTPEAATEILKADTKLPPETIAEIAPKVAQSQDVGEISTIIKDAAEKHAEYAKSQGYSPYTPNDQLPTIQVGKVEGDGLPVIQTKPKATKGELTYEPIESRIEASPVQKELPVTPEAKNNTPVAKVEIPKVTGENSNTSGVAKDINTKAIEQGLTAEYKDMATYEPRTIKEQAAKISELIEHDPEDLGRILRGEKPVPEGMSASYLVTAADKYATKTKNAKLLQDLISSKLTGEGSQHASELRMLGERDQSSAMKALKEVQAAREEVATNKLKGKKLYEVKRATVKEIAGEVKKNTPKKQDWAAFVESITC